MISGIELVKPAGLRKSWPITWGILPAWVRLPKGDLLARFTFEPRILTSSCNCSKPNFGGYVPKLGEEGTRRLFDPSQLSGAWLGEAKAFAKKQWLEGCRRGLKKQAGFSVGSSWVKSGCKVVGLALM